MKASPIWLETILEKVRGEIVAVEEEMEAGSAMELLIFLLEIDAISQKTIPRA